MDKPEANSSRHAGAKLRAQLAAHPELVTIARFALVGMVGFAVDIGVLSIAVYALGAPALPARVASIVVSVLVTWLLNRAWTFRARRKESAFVECLRYFGSRIVGVSANLALFAALIRWAPAPFSLPPVATTLASAATMMINYILARLLIYHRRFG